MKSTKKRKPAMKHEEEKEPTDNPPSDSERISALEARLDLIVRSNCLREVERVLSANVADETVEKP